MSGEFKENVNEIWGQITSKFKRDKLDDSKRKRRRNKTARMGEDWHKQIAPRKGYQFHSDWFNIDNQAATIQNITFRAEANRGMPPFWGVSLIPRAMRNNLNNSDLYLIQNVEQIPRQEMEKMQHRADTKSSIDNDEAGNQKASKRHRFRRRQEDFDRINEDIASGDAYYRSSFRMLIKAPRESTIDQEVEDIKVSYSDNKSFSGISLLPYDGRQRKELSNIFTEPSMQYGAKEMFTSTELAGSYNLVTQGFSDRYGEDCGLTFGDYNETKLHLDVDNFRDHVVIASDLNAATASGIRQNTNEKYFPSGTPGAALWTYKITDNALANGYRVIHLVLDNTPVDKIGEPGLLTDEYTDIVAMDAGDLNPFHIFGSKEHELSAWSEHVNKLMVMAKEMNSDLSDTDLGTNFMSIMKDFYQQLNMYVTNPEEHLDDLRLVGLPYEEYPSLHRFCTYLRAAREQAAKDGDLVRVQSIEKLYGVFNLMEDKEGDLFNVKTSHSIDTAQQSQQVIYKFSDLMQRSEKTAMAQVVNALGFALSTCRKHDVVIIHGAELLNDSVKQYMKTLFRGLHRKGVRFVYAYDKISDALKDTEFNELTEADYFLMGKMSDRQMHTLADTLGEAFPKTLADHITTGGDDLEDCLWLLRKGYRNVVFIADPVIVVDDDLLNANRISTKRGMHTGPVYVDFPGKKK